MNGYGSHTFSFINDANERFWVKFHFKTEQGHSFYTDEEAATASARIGRPVRPICSTPSSGATSRAGRSMCR